MSRHQKFLGSDSQPVEAGVVNPTEVNPTIKPSVEEIEMTNETQNNAETKETMETLVTLKVREKFRKGSVAYAGILSGAISAIAMLASRAGNPDVKLNNKDILLRTAVNATAATAVQAGVQLAANSLNGSGIASYATAHLVGCVAAPVGMHVMVSKGIGASGYEVEGALPEVEVLLPAPVENEL